ncbi:MAG TPA: hypothetical protein VGQ38_05280 [Gaiellaceae bacterium]|nr:hypothetical protein [Gaiellaceae bacterium]
MSLRLSAAAAIVVASASLTATALATHQRASTCSTNQGKVKGYLPTAHRACAGGIVITNAILFNAETINTGTPGQFTFGTSHLYYCQEGASARDQIQPTAAVALLHLAGKTWCYHRKGDPKTTLATRNAKIFTNGTIIGLTLDKTGLLVQLADGSARVTSTVTSQSVTVTSGHQVLVAPNGRIGKPTPLLLGPLDQISVAEIQSDVVQMGAAQVAEHVKRLRLKGIVVIGDTTENAQLLQQQLPGVATDALTVDQVQQTPEIVRQELARLGTRAIATIGNFGVVSSVWPILRTTAQLPPGATIDYVQI